MTGGAHSGGSLPAERDPRLAAIFLVVLMDVLGLTIILPLLPFYAEKLGAAPATVGLLVASYSACQFVASPILGYLSDRIGRKPVLLLSQIGTFSSFVLLAYAPSLAWVFAARLLDGFTAGNLSTAQAYISDVSTPQNRAKELGKIGIAFAIGFFIGPALTAFLYRFGYRAPFLVAAALSLSSVVATATLLPREPRSTPTTGNAKGRGAGNPPAVTAGPSSKVRFLFLEILLFYLAFSAFVSGFALYAERRFVVGGARLDARQVGYAFAYFGAIGIVTQGLLIQPLVRRFTETRVALLGFLSSMLGYGLFGWIHAWLGIALAGLFSGFGGNILRPVLLSEIAGETPPRERGRVMGFASSLQSIAQITAPLAATALIGAGRLNEWAIGTATISGVAALLVLMRLRRQPSET